MFNALHTATEAASTKSNRAEAEALILSTIATLDPSKMNTKRYIALFAKMNDQEFALYMQNIKDKKVKLVLYVPNLKLNVKLKDIFKAATDLGLQLFERLKLWDSTTKRYYLTPQQYPVVLLPVRRLKQFLTSKISVPENDKKIDVFSGQVIKPDKGSSVSSVEMQTILSKGLSITAMELIRIRGGDINAYTSFKSQLENTGVASLNMIDDDSRARSSVILSTYLKSAHIDNNL